MPASGQIRGMLLEEALLFLLRKSGYKTVDAVDKRDKTLSKIGAGLQVQGRAIKHQIDAIADYTITPPFSYPNRLLLEAKNYSGTVGIEIIRNALGTIRDIDEYWIPTKKSVPLKKRFHYQYAIATTGKFSPDAQNFAFAHDIYLIPLARDRYFQPIISAMNNFTDQLTVFKTDQPLNLKKLRSAIRENLRTIVTGHAFQPTGLRLTERALEICQGFIAACKQVDNGFIALINRRFPVFLVPNPEVNFSEIIQKGEINVSIYWDHEGWYINSAENGRALFSFDIPEEVLRLYMAGNILPASRALDLKEQNLAEMQLITTLREQVQFLTLRLDKEWISELRKKGKQEFH